MRKITATRATPTASPTVSTWERADSASSVTSPVSSRNLASIWSRVMRSVLGGHGASFSGLVRLWPRLIAQTARAATMRTTTVQMT